MNEHVRILVITHGSAGAAMLEAMGRLLGEASLVDFEAMEVKAAEPKAAITERISAALGRLDEGAGVLVVYDLLGSTPANCALEMRVAGAHIDVLGGVNLPMLVKLASAAHVETTPGALATAAAETAIRSIRGSQT